MGEALDPRAAGAKRLQDKVCVVTVRGREGVTVMAVARRLTLNCKTVYAMLAIEEKDMTHQAILWRRLDQPGHESAYLSFQEGTWRLTGTAVFAHQQQPCRLDYGVTCDAQWHTLSGRVTGWMGGTTVDIALSVDAARRWWINDTACPEVAGCIDLDLNFSPSTNLLPMRRLGLAIGQAAEVKAAWLRFPGFTLEPLVQVYHRLDDATYRYESAGGQFVTELQVNPGGFVIHYPNFWHLEADSG